MIGAAVTKTVSAHALNCVKLNRALRIGKVMQRAGASEAYALRTLPSTREVLIPEFSL